MLKKLEEVEFAFDFLDGFGREPSVGLGGVELVLDGLFPVLDLVVVFLGGKLELSPAEGDLLGEVWSWAYSAMSAWRASGRVLSLASARGFSEVSMGVECLISEFEFICR